MTPAQASLLDSLRAAAAQIVLIGHIYSIVLRPERTLGIGDLGVVVFFVLSGFLIGYTTLNRCSATTTVSGAIWLIVSAGFSCPTCRRSF